jgi:hypothetical protein
MRILTAFVALLVVAAVAVSFQFHGPTVGLIALFVGLAALDSFAGALGIGGALTVAGGTFNNLQNALKRRYDDAALGEVGWSKGPLGAMIRKKAWSGLSPTYAMRVGNSPARSAGFSVVKSKSEDTTYGFTTVKQPQLSWVTDYGRATIAGLLLATAGDKLGTFYDKFVAQIDGILDATMHSFCTKVYRDGFGWIANISSTTNLATAILNLAIREDAVLFEKGMDYAFSSSANAAVLRNAGAVLTCIAIDYKGGNITFNANLNTVTGISTGDFIFASGDRQNSATPTPLAIPGLAAWMPVSAPTPGENFNNLGDRNNDGRLLGTYVDGRTLSEEEALIQSAVEADRMGGRPSMAFMNPTRYGNLITQGQGRYRPATVMGKMGIGFKGVTVETNYGDINVFSDRYCPRQQSYVLEMDAWMVYGAGTSKIPDFLTQDGNKILRLTDDDGIECRVGYYGAQGCNAPCHNVVIQHE